MRLFITLAALTAAPMAMAQEAPCQSASTFSARRCAQAVTEALEAAEQSRETLAILAECDGYKKKKDLRRCVSDMVDATRVLGRASRVLAAAHESGAAPAPSTGTQMTR